MTREKQEDSVESLNEVLNFKLCQLHSEDSLIDMVQIGQTKESDEDIPKDWIKCHFKSGNTYVYTKEQYVSVAIKRSNQAIGEDISRLQKKIQEERDNSESKKVDESLNEEEKIQKRSRNGLHKFKVSINPNIVDEDKYSKSLGQIFDSWIESISSLRDPYGGFADSERIFREGFMQVYTGQFQKISNDPEQDIAKVVTLTSDIGPVVFYNTSDLDSSNGAQIWSQGIIPIAYTGKKCVKKATEASQLDDQSFSLENLGEVEIPDDKDDDIKFEKALDDVEDQES